MNTFWIDVSVYWPFGATVLYLLAGIGTGYFIKRVFCGPGEAPDLSMVLFWPLSLPAFGIAALCQLLVRWRKRKREKRS